MALVRFRAIHLILRKVESYIPLKQPAKYNQTNPTAIMFNNMQIFEYRTFTFV